MSVARDEPGVAVVGQPGGMSLAAYGLLAYLEAFPQCTSSELKREFGATYREFQSAFRELTAYGYMPRDKGYERRCRVCNGYYGPVEGANTYWVTCGTWVKIGRTTKPIAERLRALNGRSRGVLCPADMDPNEPVVLEHMTSGDYEHFEHEINSLHHVRGEWFTAEPVLERLGAF